MQPAAEARSRRDVFFTLVVAYLTLPSVIFLLGWVRPAVGLPAALIVAAAAVWLGWRDRLPAPRPALSRNLWFTLVSLAGLWTLFCGVGGFFPQSNDYLKHNLLFHDLITLSWPVKYPHAGGTSYLCYGLGYYLVPTAGARLCGGTFLPVLTFLWTAAGVLLFFYWLATQTRSPRTTLAVVLLFSTTGILWSLFKRYGVPGLVPPSGLESALLGNGLYFNYSDSFTRFDYQPQHALAGWLGTVVFLERLWLQAKPRGLVFIWSACLLWSPLTCLGLLIIPLAALRRVRWQDYFEPINLIGGGVLLILFWIYFQGHVPLLEKGFVWHFSTGASWLMDYGLFLVLTMSPLGFMVLLEQKYRMLGAWRPLFFMAVTALVLLPLYKLGFAGDLRLEASSPAILILALAAARMLASESFSLKRSLCQLLLASLLLGAVFPITRPWLNVLSRTTDFSYPSIVQTTGSQTLADMRADDFDVAAQYLGRSDSLAAHWLLR